MRKTEPNRVRARYSLGLSLFRCVVRPLMLVVLSSHGTLLCAQSLNIRLVDGRNGHPMTGAGSHVNVWVGTERKEAVSIPTDRNGVARLRFTDGPSDTTIPNTSNDRGSIVVTDPVVKYDESLRINVPYAWCEPGGSNYSWLMLEHFSTKQMFQQGYVSPNACGKATASPKPGEMIIFVRPLTWLERLKE